MSENPKKLSRKFYESELIKLQIELVKLQSWVKKQNHRRYGL